MIFPEDYVVPFLLFLTSGFAVFTFGHAYWEKRRVKTDPIAQEIAAYLIDRQKRDFIAVRRGEWKWAAEGDVGFHTVVTPWPKPPWMGTKYEAFYEDTYGDA